MLESMVSIGALGAPRLYDGQLPSEAVGSVWWSLAAFVCVVLVGITAWRLVRRRMLSAERDAFVRLARGLGLSRSERKAVDRLAERAGVEAVGLLLCESAFIRASHGEALPVSAQRVVESRVVLLTAQEHLEIGRLAERIFGPSAMSSRADWTRTEPEEVVDEHGKWVA